MGGRGDREGVTGAGEDCRERSGYRDRFVQGGRRSLGWDTGGEVVQGGEGAG